MSWFIVFPQEQRQATRENVERKQARTSDELEVKPSILNIYLIFFVFYHLILNYFTLGSQHTVSAHVISCTNQ